MKKLKNPVQIREELRDEFMFSTDDGMEIDNDEIYSSRYVEKEGEKEEFQILINDEWHSIEGIDFEFL